MKMYRIENNIEKRILKVEEDIWKLKNPNDFKLLDEVYIDSSYNIYVIIGIGLVNTLPIDGLRDDFEWRYKVCRKTTLKVSEGYFSMIRKTNI